MISRALVRRAVKSEDSGDWNAAARYFAAAIRRGAPHHKVHYQLGRALEKTGDWPRAAAAYQSAVDIDPAHPNWHYRLGRALEKTGDWPRAAAAYQSAVDIDPAHPNWHYRLGRMFEKTGQWLGAASAYQAAVSRDPNHPQWFFRLGSAFLKVRNFHSSSHCFRQADKLFYEAGQQTQSPPSHKLAYAQRIELSLLVRPAYAYCVYRGARLAKRLGIDHISVLEFGVAGGNGLVALESHAAQIEELEGVKIDVFGFDSGEGLYKPADHRDMPYYFAPGQYRIDIDKLERRLERAHLIIGDARKTFAKFVEEDHPPIAATSFDMDYYSSTSGVLKVAGEELHEQSFLPRTYNYFDDVTGEGLQDYNEFTGELLAIAEFNADHSNTKFAPDRHFLARPFKPTWSENIYTLHRFGHPDYGKYVGHSTPKSLSFRE